MQSAQVGESTEGGFAPGQALPLIDGRVRSFSAVGRVGVPSLPFAPRSGRMDLHAVKPSVVRFGRHLVMVSHGDRVWVAGALGLNLGMRSCPTVRSRNEPTSIDSRI